MNKALEQKMVERWPIWFNTSGDIQDAAMSQKRRNPIGFGLTKGTVIKTVK